MPKFAARFKNSGSSSYQVLSATTYQWQPGLRRAPGWGVAGLILALASTFVSVLVLIFSNGKPINTWRFQPTVYLAIASTITNIALCFALFQGVAVSWWQKAMQSGTTIADLHRVWDYGNNFHSAITSGRYINAVATASVLVALSPINGPLLQRASTIGRDNSSSTRLLKIEIAKLLPVGYSGIVSSRGDTVNALRANFSLVARDYYNRAPIKVVDTTCRGRCVTKIIGAGFHVSCTSYQVPYNISPPNFDAPIVFGTNALFDSLEHPTLMNLSSQIKSEVDCLGQLQVQNCTLQAGTVEYPVVIDGPSKTIALLDSIWDDTVIGDTDSLDSETHLEGKTTYGGIWLALQNQWTVALELGWGGAISYEYYGRQSEKSLAYARNIDGAPDCTVYFTDPMPDFLEAARELIFRSAIALGNSSTVQQVLSEETTNLTCYHTDYRFLALATAASLIALFSVLCTYNRFWTLGRKCTLSPIEVAKAFNAPLLRGSNSNAPLPDLLSFVGPRAVRYGAVTNLEGSTWTGPENEMNTYVDGEPAPRLRLELADPTKVSMVATGTMFRD